MRPMITMEIRPETYEDLLTLAEALGFPPEAAMGYAVRLVNACIQEGLLPDLPIPEPAASKPKAAGGGKIIAFPVKRER